MCRYLIFFTIALTSLACKRQTVILEPPGVAMAKGLAGTWKWKRDYSYWDNTRTKDTVYALPDTTFDITYSKDSTINVAGWSLVYTGNSSMFKEHVFIQVPLGPRGMEKRLIYGGGQITFINRQGGLGGGGTITHTTYK